MLTTNLRTTQALDPTTGVTRAVARPFALFGTATGPAVCSAAVCNATAVYTSANGSWSFIGRTPMPKANLHPDRWPLQSTS